MKVLLVSRCAWTLYNFRGGLIRALIGEGVDVEGAGAAGDGYEERIRGLGIPFHPVPIRKRGMSPVADIRLLWSLYKWYRRESPDVVHHFTIKPVIFGSLAAWLAGIPRIVNTVTGLGFAFTGDRRWLRLVVEFLYSVALRPANLTFFQNPEDRKLFVEKHLVTASKTCVVPGSGVDISHFDVQNSTRGSGAPGYRVVFLMMSRLLRDKGVYEFIDAAREVKRGFPLASFRLLGERDERNPSVLPLADLESWCREGIVEWLGRAADVRPYIADADVIVLPSYREGTPRSLLEGAAMGKALIATDTTGCREVIEHGHNGLLVPIRDSRALASAMIRLIEHPGLRERMGKAGRHRVEREFDERIVIRKTLAAYGIPLPT